MQIHYLWVNDFGRLQKIGINLSARLIIEMVPDTSRDNYILTISENPDYIENFFKNSDVANVTAIIGKNGAGKSTILNYIKSNLPQGKQAGINNDLFIYSIEEASNTQQYFIIKPEQIDVKIINKTSIKFDEKFYGENSGQDFRFAGHLGNAEYIYYSYLLDFNEDMQPWMGLSNISTTFLMMEDRRRITEENRDELTRINLLSQCNDLDNLHVSEVARAIQFLLSNSTTLPFDKPENLYIEVDLTDCLFFTDQESKYPEIAKLIKAFQSERSISGNVADELTRNFLLAVFVNFLINDYKYSPNNPYFHPLQPLRNDESAEEYIIKYFTSMSQIELERDGRKVYSPRHELLSNLVPIFLATLKQLIAEQTITVRNGKTLLLKLNEKTESAFKDFSKLYLQIKGISSFLNFRWRTLSGGEQSYLSLMSRFFYVRHHKSLDLSRNLVILIDEGDIGYHPEWQRRFLDVTLTFLSELFAGHKMQLIITANTPFLSSDLPKAHVLFIEWIDKHLSIFHSRDNNRDSPFAANIHTLLSNSFYMDGVLMGEYAKKRINSIIEYIKAPLAPGSQPDIDYKKTIDIIGEPVLRKKLQDMWFEAFGLDEELRILENRIAEIKKQKNKK